ncbi:hypothetical protein, partial [Piscinibacter sp.]|uniref:hypothetical protein n=1 Tax=Piscinibacter sp. TaxID=1903157 RepID=UPI002BAA392C
GRWQVSTDGGGEPRWARNGRELYFTAGGGGGGILPRLIVAAKIHDGAGFVADKPTILVKLPQSTSAAYDVGADGRFLVHVPADGMVSNPSQRPHIVVVQRWFDELRARVPLTPSP